MVAEACTTSALRPSVIVLCLARALILLGVRLFLGFIIIASGFGGGENANNDRWVLLRNIK